jgi:hypothetical protein
MNRLEFGAKRKRRTSKIASRLRSRKIMFSDHRLLKDAGPCFVLPVILLAIPKASQAQSSRAKSAASYFVRGSEWQAALLTTAFFWNLLSE